MSGTSWREGDRGVLYAMAAVCTILGFLLAVLRSQEGGGDATTDAVSDTSTIDVTTTSPVASVETTTTQVVRTPATTPASTGSVTPAGSPSGTVATTPPPQVPQPLYLATVEPSTFEGGGSFGPCDGDARIKGVGYIKHACWDLFGDQLYSEWPIGTHSQLLGTGGILDVCASDTTFQIRVIVDGQQRLDQTLRVGGPMPLSVSIAGGARVGLMILNPNRSYDECVSIGEFRLE